MTSCQQIYKLFFEYFLNDSDTEAFESDSELISLLQFFRNLKAPASVPLCLAFAVRVHTLIDLMLRGDQAMIRSQIDNLASSFDQIASRQHDLFSAWEQHLFCDAISDYAEVALELNRVRNEVEILHQRVCKSLPCAAPIFTLVVLSSSAQLREMILDLLFETQMLPALACVHELSANRLSRQPWWPDLDYLEKYTGSSFTYCGRKPSLTPKEIIFEDFQKRFGSRPASYQEEFEDESDYIGELESRAVSEYKCEPSASFALTPLYDIHTLGDSFVPWNRRPEKVEFYAGAILLREIIGEPAFDLEFTKAMYHFCVGKYYSQPVGSKTQMPLTHSDMAGLIQKHIIKELTIMCFDFVAFSEELFDLVALLTQLRHDSNRRWICLDDQDSEDARKYELGHVMRMFACEFSRYIANSTKSRSPAAERRVLADCIYISDAVADFLTQNDEKGIECGKRGIAGITNAQLGSPLEKHVSTLPPTLLRRLKHIHQQYRLRDNFGTAEVRKGIDWLEDLPSWELELKRRCQ